MTAISGGTFEMEHPIPAAWLRRRFVPDWLADLTWATDNRFFRCLCWARVS